MAVGILALLLSACGDKSKNFSFKEGVLQLYQVKDFSRGKKLHILFINRSDFPKLKNKGLYFTYVLNNTDGIYTLHGWPTRKPWGGGIKFDIDDKDIVKLQKGDLSDVDLTGDIYLSPLYLRISFISIPRYIPTIPILIGN
jgi:hypothetical protein